MVWIVLLFLCCAHGLARQVLVTFWSLRLALCVSVWCVCCGLCAHRAVVDNSSRWLAVHPVSLFHWAVVPDEAFPKALPQNVDKLHHIQSYTEDGCAAHDVEEDLFFSGFSDVTVHCVGAWALTATDQNRHLKAIIDKVKGQQESYLQIKQQKLDNIIL